MTDFYDPPARWPLQEELEELPLVSYLTSGEVAMLRDMTPLEAAEWIVARMKEEEAK